jgi:hypothetical protein
MDFETELSTEYYSKQGNAYSGVVSFTRHIRKKYPQIPSATVKAWVKSQPAYQKTQEPPGRHVRPRKFPSAFTNVTAPRFLLTLDSMYLPLHGVSKWPAGGNYKFLVAGTDAMTGEVSCMYKLSAKFCNVLCVLDSNRAYSVPESDSSYTSCIENH